MAIKDLLAVVDTGDKDEQFILDALKFTEFHEARLTFVIISLIPSANYGGIYGTPYEFMQEFAEAVEAKHKIVADRTRLAAIEVRTISDQWKTIATEAAVQARYVDMVLFGSADTYAYPPTRRHTMESILFSSGRPVLVLPEGYAPRVFDHLAIGWNATREATHALRDATAIAAARARIEVLVLNAHPSTKGHGPDPGADIAHHLVRHGFAPNVITLNARERPDGEMLVDAARRTGAGLLALGAYGHSRLREMILGGVTRELLAGVQIPLLFSH